MFLSEYPTYESFMDEVGKRVAAFTSAVTPLAMAVTDPKEWVEGDPDAGGWMTAYDFGEALATEMLDAEAAFLIIQKHGVKEVESYDGPTRWFTYHVTDEVVERLAPRPRVVNEHAEAVTA